jgi:hypothetical protein
MRASQASAMRQRGVAGEGSDLEDVARAHQLRQQPHEGALLRRDLHDGILAELGLRFHAQLREDGRLARRMGAVVVEDRALKDDSGCAHDAESSFGRCTKRV